MGKKDKHWGLKTHFVRHRTRNRKVDKKEKRGNFAMPYLALGNNDQGKQKEHTHHTPIENPQQAAVPKGRERLWGKNMGFHRKKTSQLQEMTEIDL